jgi:1,4-dihydroxy-2-naphthoyl-CoA synthase
MSTTPRKKRTFDGKYRDILYTVKNSIATIAINRPEKLNAFTQHTIYEWEDASGVQKQTKMLG